MRACVVFVVLIVVCFGEDASCPVFVVQNKDGATFSYDLSSLKKPNNDPTKFITAQEPGGGWTAYLNICGDASVVGCSTSTPLCQQSGNMFFSMGSPNWIFSPYFDPTKGPHSPIIPDGGVVVTAIGGSPCAAPVSANRKSILFFQCDPTVTTFPRSASIQESDPSDPFGQPTPCQYFWTGLKYSGFCPSPPLSVVSSSAVFPSSFKGSSANPKENLYLSFATTTFIPNSSGLSCTPSNQDCSVPYRQCQVQISNGTTFVLPSVNLTDIIISNRLWRASWSAFEPTNSRSDNHNMMKNTMPTRNVADTRTCHSGGAGYVLASDLALVWSYDPQLMVWTLATSGHTILNLKLSSPLDGCLECNNK